MGGEVLLGALFVHVESSIEDGIKVSGGGRERGCMGHHCCGVQG